MMAKIISKKELEVSYFKRKKEDLETQIELINKKIQDSLKNGSKYIILGIDDIFNNKEEILKMLKNEGFKVEPNGNSERITFL
jgi:hypothetical protein